MPNDRFIMRIRGWNIWDRGCGNVCGMHHSYFLREILKRWGNEFNELQDVSECQWNILNKSRIYLLRSLVKNSAYETFLIETFMNGTSLQSFNLINIC
jgi:hypothetical protein